MEPKPPTGPLPIQPVRVLAGTLTMPPQSRIDYSKSPTYGVPPPPTLAEVAERLARVERALGPLDDQGRLLSLPARGLRLVGYDGRECARLFMGDCGPVLQFLDHNGKVRVGVGMGDDENGIAIFNDKGERTWWSLNKRSWQARMVARRLWAMPWKWRAPVLLGIAALAGLVVWLAITKPLAYLIGR